MVKKVILGVALCGLIGFLVVGAVRRTIDRTSQISETAGGQGRSRNEQSDHDEDTVREDNSQSWGWGANRVETGAPDSTGDPDNTTDMYWLTHKGTVFACDDKMLTVALSESDMLTVEGQAWSYAQAQGFVATSGDQLVVRGFFEHEEFKPAQIDNLTTGAIIILRDEAGRPGWSGGRGWGGA